MDPRKPRGDKFLETYPYILPNLVAAAFFCIGIVTGWLFLKVCFSFPIDMLKLLTFQESLETKKHDRDVGLIIGANITAWFRKTFHLPKRQKKKIHAERAPLLAHQKTIDGEEATPNGPSTSRKVEEAPKLRDVLSYQTTLNLIVYTFLALYTLAYDQVRPHNSFRA